MKAIVLCLALMFLGHTSFSQSQGEMIRQAADSLKLADKGLNTVYQKILTEYKDDTTFIKNLKISQRVWIQFRDAEMEMKYPKREDGYYGSVQPMCWAMYKEKLTRERIKTLKEWINGIEEGDVCSGSVKIKE